MMTRGWQSHGGPAQVAEPACYCAGGEWRTVFRTRKFGLVKCTGCGCFRIDPPPIAHDTAAENFYTEYYEDKAPAASQAGQPAAPARNSRYWRVADQVSSLHNARGRVVDVGCGEGTLCGELQAAGYTDVCGIDVSASRVARARMRFPTIDFRVGQIEALDSLRDSVQLITFDNVVEHLPDPLGFVGKLRQLLAPGGRLVMITPNMRSGHFRLLGRRWTNELAPHAHIFLFTPEALCRLTTMAGLDIEASGSFHLPLERLRNTARRALSAGLKSAAFRAMIDAGGVAGRVLGEGEMQYVVARRGPGTR